MSKSALEKWIGEGIKKPIKEKPSAAPKVKPTSSPAAAVPSTQTDSVAGTDDGVKTDGQISLIEAAPSSSPEVWIGPAEGETVDPTSGGERDLCSGELLCDHDGQVGVTSSIIGAAKRISMVSVPRQPRFFGRC